MPAKTDRASIRCEQQTCTCRMINTSTRDKSCEVVYMQRNIPRIAEFYRIIQAQGPGRTPWKDTIQYPMPVMYCACKEIILWKQWCKRQSTMALTASNKRIVPKYCGLMKHCACHSFIHLSGFRTVEMKVGFCSRLCLHWRLWPCRRQFNPDLAGEVCTGEAVWLLSWLDSRLLSDLGKTLVNRVASCQKREIFHSWRYPDGTVSLLFATWNAKDGLRYPLPEVPTRHLYECFFVQAVHTMSTWQYDVGRCHLHL